MNHGSTAALVSVSLRELGLLSASACGEVRNLWTGELEPAALVGGILGKQLPEVTLARRCTNWRTALMNRHDQSTAPLDCSDLRCMRTHGGHRARARRVGVTVTRHLVKSSRMPLFAHVALLAVVPMRGWMTWERYTCEVDCTRFPETCISEHLIMSTADAMKEEGFVDAGYTYIQIDDCWQAPHRDPSGAIVPDPKRFPSGMKALSDYVKSKGMQLGLYGDIGTHTCGGASHSRALGCSSRAVTA